jgi:hypothetical protein
VPFTSTPPADAADTVAVSRPPTTAVLSAAHVVPPSVLTS